MPFWGILCWTGRVAISFMVALLLFPIWHVAFVLIMTFGRIECAEDKIGPELGLFIWIVAASFLALYFGKSIRFHVLFLHGLALFGIAWGVTVQAFNILVGSTGEVLFQPRGVVLGLDAVMEISLLILIAEVLILAALVVERGQGRGFIRENTRPPLD